MKKAFLIVVVLVCSLAARVRGEGVLHGSPEYARCLRDGADAKLTLKIVDEEGMPVDNAKIGAHFQMANRGGIEGSSTTNGLFTMEDKSQGRMHYGVRKLGYYRTSGEYIFGRHDGVVVRDGKWQPWNPEITVVLRKVMAPIPMYARIVDTKNSAGKEGLGFDLEVGDWTQPAGKGVVSDFVFNMEGFWHSYRDNDSSLGLTFSNDRDGMIAVNSAEMNAYSDFLMPRYAPEDGYQNAWSWRRARTMEEGASQDRIVDDLVSGGNYLFRVRSQTNDLGVVTNAYYGKIRGNIEFIGAATGAQGSWIKFTYYLNPTANDRNLEFDPKQNLFENLPSLESVREP